jgi:TRAP-type C4-dicarboxylate transport system substrate-binding protein
MYDINGRLGSPILICKSPRVAAELRAPHVRAIVIVQKGKSMFKTLAQCALLWLALLPAASAAEPIKLKMAYFSSDRTTTYLAAIKPFVDAVNAEAQGLVQIDVSLSGTLGKNPTQQLQLVLDGTADLAFVVPGYTPERFPDNEVVELPGLFKNNREATLVYTGLIAANALRGYDDLFVVGAFGAEPETIHTRLPAASLEALAGTRIRSNNPVQAAALAGLGMVPVEVPINQTSGAISSGKLDGAMTGPAPLVEFGISRVVSNHYLLAVSAAPLLVVMNRKKFEGIPEQAKQIIRKFSGEWAAERYIEIYRAVNNASLESLKQDPNRTVVVPSPADLARANAVFSAEVDTWSAADPRHRQLLAEAEAELYRIRGGTIGRR